MDFNIYLLLAAAFFGGSVLLGQEFGEAMSPTNFNLPGAVEQIVPGPGAKWVKVRAW